MEKDAFGMRKLWDILFSSIVEQNQKLILILALFQVDFLQFIFFPEFSAPSNALPSIGAGNEHDDNEDESIAEALWREGGGGGRS